MQPVVQIRITTHALKIRNYYQLTVLLANIAVEPKFEDTGFSGSITCTSFCAEKTGRVGLVAESLMLGIFDFSSFSRS